MWESLGFIIAFAYSNFICTRVKIIIIMTVLLIGMVGYLYIEIRTGRETSEAHDLSDNTNPKRDSYESNENRNVELVSANMNGQEFEGMSNKAFDQTQEM